MYLLASCFTFIVESLVIFNTDWTVVFTKGKWITTVCTFVHIDMVYDWLNCDLTGTWTVAVERFSAEGEG